MILKKDQKKKIKMNSYTKVSYKCIQTAKLYTDAYQLDLVFMYKRKKWPKYLSYLKVVFTKTGSTK